MRMLPRSWTRGALLHDESIKQLLCHFVKVIKQSLGSENEKYARYFQASELAFSVNMSGNAKLEVS